MTLGFASDQDIEDTAVTALTDTAPTGTNENTYEVDNTAPTVDSASASGMSLVVTFSEDLGQADNLVNSAFTVEKTPTGGSAQSVALAGSPAIDGKTVTLTLGAAVVPGTDDGDGELHETGHGHGQHARRTASATRPRASPTGR